MPQPSRQTWSSGASLQMLASEISGTIVYSEKVLVPMKWWTRDPSFEKRLVSSGINPRPWVSRTAPQRLVLPEVQNLHSPHSAV